MNKKGITIIELLVSISLVSIVLLLLLRVMFSLNNINNASNYASSDEISRTTIIKNIENDFLNFKLKDLEINKLANKTEINLFYENNTEEKIIIKEKELTYKDTYSLETNKAYYDLEPVIIKQALDEDYYLIMIKIKVLMEDEKDAEKDDIVLTYVGLKNNNEDNTN